MQRLLQECICNKQWSLCLENTNILQLDEKHFEYVLLQELLAD